MTIELQNDFVHTSSLEKQLEFDGSAEPLKNEAGKSTISSDESVGRDVKGMESVISNSLASGVQDSMVFKSESAMDCSVESVVDGSDSPQEQLQKVYPGNLCSVEASKSLHNGHKDELKVSIPPPIISSEWNINAEDTPNEQMRRNLGDGVVPVLSEKEIEVNNSIQDPISQEQYNVNQDTLRKSGDKESQTLAGSDNEMGFSEMKFLENGTSVRSADELSCHEESIAKFESDKVPKAECLPQVLSATDVSETAEIKKEQERSNLNSKDCAPVVDQKTSQGMIRGWLKGEKSAKKSPVADNMEPLEKKSVKNPQKSPEEFLNSRIEQARKSSKRDTRLLVDKPSRLTSEASRAQPGKSSEQLSQATQNGILGKKPAKGSPDKPPKSSPLKPPKPAENVSTDMKESIPKSTVADNTGLLKQPSSSSLDKSVKGSVEKVAKQRASPLKSRPNGNNGSVMGDGKLRGSPSSTHTSDKDARSRLESPGVSPFIFKLVKSCKGHSEDPFKALDYALHSVKFYEKSSDESHRIELVMSLHVLAVVYCRLGQYEEAIAVLERSLALSTGSSHADYARASYSGYMQLGDTLALLGRHETSVDAYQAALTVQKEALGEVDLRIGDTCRYLAEAHLQAMQLDEAEMVCQHLLKIHSDCSSPGSVEEAADRRLMALICSEKGDHEKALEYLVLASMALISDGQNLEAAFVQSSIGNTYVKLGRFEDAVFAYQKALTVFKSVKNENHSSVASVYVSLADLYMKTGRHREAKIYSESALRIYKKHDGSQYTDEVASGLTEIAYIYEALNEPEQALHLLQNALDLVQGSPGQQSAIAGIQAQMGVLCFLQGKPAEAFAAFKNAVILLKSATKKRSSLLGILLNQMGLACVELYEIVDAAELFEEAKGILEETCGHDHPDTLSICGNLAGAYDALGRLDDAIQLSKTILKVKEERFGREHSEVHDETIKVRQLQNEVNFPRLWRKKLVT